MGLSSVMKPAEIVRVSKMEMDPWETEEDISKEMTATNAKMIIIRPWEILVNVLNFVKRPSPPLETPTDAPVMANVTIKEFAFVTLPILKDTFKD